MREGDALIVVDRQNDFCAAGALAVPDGDGALAPVSALTGNAPVVGLTQDRHPAGHSSFAALHPGKAPCGIMRMPFGEQAVWPDHCVQGRPGAAFHPAPDFGRADLIIRKGTRRAIDCHAACFENDRAMPTGLDRYLRDRGISRLTLAGLAADFRVAAAQGACRAIDRDGSPARSPAGMRATARDAGVTGQPGSPLL